MTRYELLCEAGIRIFFIIAILFLAAHVAVMIYFAQGGDTVDGWVWQPGDDDPEPDEPEVEEPWIQLADDFPEEEPLEQLPLPGMEE